VFSVVPKLVLLDLSNFYFYKGIY